MDRARWQSAANAGRAYELVHAELGAVPPDATIDSRWIKVRGVSVDGGQLDLWSGGPFTHDNRNLSPYQTEPWQNLVYYRLYAR